ncbi:aldehyde ferredoxin oxidoreductase [Natranaerofaba carboxydovora]|uniref:aldehyde ferredoxin oxidoreductase n=1 Tax=Natranaerofaba carboxydovora TaxID=2742683 RepID=UPI001F143987|nr:aldehyde ferredoxin oxidoreductase [Natranaerofaba carboxydovora]UMZ72902.1 putative oxidoreductase YdhV [Natranaerofaba carboxydovora]
MANGGWTGKILRVNLTDRTVTEESTEKYKDYLGGMGIGYKVLWDEVPADVEAFDEENKLVFGVGPLTGSGTICSGRTTIVSLYPGTPNHLPTDSHMGGHWGPELKFAGWDSIIIEGKADSLVWLRIEDDKVTIEDASRLEQQGIYRTTTEICEIMGPEAQVAAIGQAGENMVNMSVIMNSWCHSAGGHGGVMGSKNLKAVGVRGTGTVKVADPAKWRECDDDTFYIIGSNNQGVVPTQPQYWSEWYGNGSRWYATPGMTWGAANPPVVLPDTNPNLDNWKNTVGYRCQKAQQDLTSEAEKYTVKMDGCYSCPIRCMGVVEVPQMEEYGLPRWAANTCLGWSGRLSAGGPRYISRLIGKHLADDYGTWCNYGQIFRDVVWAYENGHWKEHLPEDEYNEIPWDMLEDENPEFMFEHFRRVAFKEGEYGRIMGLGSYWIAKELGFSDEYYHGDEDGEGTNIWNPALGFPRHHSSESYAQVGALINMVQANFHAQNHTHQNLKNSGLPNEYENKAVKNIPMVGLDGAIDPDGHYSPMNEAKAKYAKFSIIRNVLHDALTLCNWMWPWQVSPREDLDFMGDTAMEAKYMTAVTGEEYTEDELDEIAERLWTLHRLYTLKRAGYTNMRKEHDEKVADWVFDRDPDMEPFEEGTLKMDRDDLLGTGLDMFYEEMGWDKETGIPTRQTLERLGLSYAADELGI